MSLHPLGHVAKDWPEDFSHENGNYECRCCDCGGLFIGHKRRVVCKECATAKPAHVWTIDEIKQFKDWLAKTFGWKK